MTKNNKKTGDIAEETASRFLIANGFVILERNWFYDKLEVDIIAQDSSLIVFVEVKYRKNTLYGSPVEAVSPDKSRRIIEAADQYLNVHNIDLQPRFDIIAITGQGKTLNIRHIKDAFRPEYL